MTSELRAVAPITASDVPWATCWETRKRLVRIGTRTMPPPTPSRPPASPAAKPLSSAATRSRAGTSRSGLSDARGCGALDQARGVGEAGRRGRRAQHHRDQLAALGADPGREAVARLADEAGLAAQHLVAGPVDEAVGVADGVGAAGARE